MATATAQSDFFDVQLTAAALKALGPKAQVRITGLCGRSHYSYLFTAGATTRVLTSEWRKVLSKKTLRGQPVLEIAPAAQPVAVAQPAAPAPAAPKSAPATETAADQNGSQGGSQGGSTNSTKGGK